MSFNSKLFITLADELINHQRDVTLKDAYYRTAISRYYYGVYLIAEEYLKTHISKGIPIPEVSHEFVRNTFQKFKETDPKREIGNNLATLWKKRKRADYKKEASISKDDVTFTGGLAKDTLKLLDSIL